MIPIYWYSWCPIVIPLLLFFVMRERCDDAGDMVGGHFHLWYDDDILWRRVTFYILFSTVVLFTFDSVSIVLGRWKVGRWVRRYISCWSIVFPFCSHCSPFAAFGILLPFPHAHSSDQSQWAISVCHCDPACCYRCSQAGSSCCCLSPFSFCYFCPIHSSYCSLCLWWPLLLFHYDGSSTLPWSCSLLLWHCCSFYPVVGWCCWYGETFILFITLCVSTLFCDDILLWYSQVFDGIWWVVLVVVDGTGCFDVYILRMEYCHYLLHCLFHIPPVPFVVPSLFVMMLFYDSHSVTLVILGIVLLVSERHWCSLLFWWYIHCCSDIDVDGIAIHCWCSCIDHCWPSVDLFLTDIVLYYSFIVIYSIDDLLFLLILIHLMVCIVISDGIHETLVHCSWCWWWWLLLLWPIDVPKFIVSDIWCGIAISIDDCCSAMHWWAPSDHYHWLFLLHCCYSWTLPIVIVVVMVLLFWFHFCSAVHYYWWFVVAFAVRWNSVHVVDWWCDYIHLPFYVFIEWLPIYYILMLLIVSRYIVHLIPVTLCILEVPVLLWMIPRCYSVGDVVSLMLLFTVSFLHSFWLECWCRFAFIRAFCWYHFCSDLLYTLLHSAVVIVIHLIAVHLTFMHSYCSWWLFTIDRWRALFVDAGHSELPILPTYDDDVMETVDTYIPCWFDDDGSIYVSDARDVIQYGAFGSWPYYWLVIPFVEEVLSMIIRWCWCVMCWCKHLFIAVMMCLLEIVLYFTFSVVVWWVILVHFIYYSVVVIVLILLLLTVTIHYSVMMSILLLLFILTLLFHWYSVWCCLLMPLISMTVLFYSFCWHWCYYIWLLIRYYCCVWYALILLFMMMTLLFIYIIVTF